MKTTYKDEFLPVPANVTVDVKSRVLRVKGPRGTLTKNLNHLDMEIIKKDSGISFQVWHGKRKHVACLRTARALIANLIIGVTKVRFYFSMETDNQPTKKKEQIPYNFSSTDASLSPTTSGCVRWKPERAH